MLENFRANVLEGANFSRRKTGFTLRFLASGNSQQSMSFSYHVGRQTVSSIIKETCGNQQVLDEKYLRLLNLPDDWEDIAEEFM